MDVQLAGFRFAGELAQLLGEGLLLVDGEVLVAEEEDTALGDFMFEGQPCLTSFSPRVEFDS